MKLIRKLVSGILAYPREGLRCIDEKIGLEIFKLGVVLSTVYFVQGMGGLSNIPLLFYFKDVLHFDEAQMQYFAAITGVAWLIKPLFGYISDRFPIFGYRRKTYMILMALTAAFSWWLLAFMVYHNYSHYVSLVLVFNFSALGYAFVDVVCDALMVERGQELGKEDVFVNLQWFALGIAGFIANVFSGELQYAVKTGVLPLWQVFIPVGMIPLLTSVISWLCVKEEKIKKISTEQAAGDKQHTDFGIIKEVVSSKIFWILTAFIFFWKFSPSFGAVFNYYTIDVLGFDERFLGKIGAIGNAIFPLSIALYAALLKWLPWIKTKHYLYASIIVGLVYYALSWLFTVQAGTFSWVAFRFPAANPAVFYWIIVPLVCFSILSIFRGALSRLLSKKRIIGRIDHGWLIALILSIAVPLAAFSRLNTRMPSGDNIIFYWMISPVIFLIVFSLIVARFKEKAPVLGKIGFFVRWPLILFLSMIVALKFGGADLQNFVLTYRSLRIVETVIFGYASIASFLIPLALAAKLAPKKAEGMTYAYFMALSNVSAGFLPDLTGAWMFKVLKKMLHSPETLIKSLPADTWLIILGGLILCALIVLVILRIRRAGEKWRKILLLSVVGLSTLGLYYLGPVMIGRLQAIAIYSVQQSYVLLQNVIGSADFLGKEAYRALIIRYFLIISCGFILTAIPFVYLLPKPKGKKEMEEK